MKQVDFFYFFGSVYAYLSVMRIGGLAAAAGVSIRWRPFNVRTVMKENNVALRTEIVKAYVVLKDGVERSAALAEEIRLWVRERLSAHEYPREVEFVDSMPLTTTGKVIRRLFRDKARAEATISD